MVYFFQASATFSIENAKFWPFLVILSQIYALFGATFTGLNNEVVPKNGQILGMRKMGWVIPLRLLQVLEQLLC